MKVAIIALIVACLAVSAMATCKWTSATGVDYDFTATKDSELIAVTDHLTYSFNFCGGTPSNALCAASTQGPAQAGCIYEPDRFWLVSSRWDNTATNHPLSIDEKPDGGLTITFQNGGNFPTGAQSRLVLDLDCGKAKSISYQETSVFPTIRLTAQSPLGCPAGSDGLSGGAIFLIVFFSVLAGYFVLGFLICKFGLKKEGIQAVPQYAFWCALPGLYIAGIKFVIGKITGKGKSSNEDYSSSAAYGSTEDV